MLMWYPWQVKYKEKRKQTHTQKNNICLSKYQKMEKMILLYFRKHADEGNNSRGNKDVDEDYFYRKEKTCSLLHDLGILFEQC